MQKSVVKGWVLGNHGRCKTLQCGGEQREHTRGGRPDLGREEGQEAVGGNGQERE